jgi:hypothetical protein
VATNAEWDNKKKIFLLMKGEIKKNISLCEWENKKKSFSVRMGKKKIFANANGEIKKILCQCHLGK